ncbi:MAG: hypothetical protein ACKOEC_17005 [Acidimicrobiia bacterium]
MTKDSPTDFFVDWPRGEPVPAISIRQPWAAAVIWLGKDVENRDHWIYKYRGPIIIHASSTKFFTEDMDEMIAVAQKDGASKEELELFAPDNYVLDLVAQGAIIGVAMLTDVFGVDDAIPESHPANGSPWGEDVNYWLCLADATACEPVALKGRVGLFKVPYETVMALKPFNFERGSSDGT